MKAPSRLALVGASLLVAALLAGCGSAPATTGTTVSSAAPVRPDGVQDPAVVPTATTSGPTSCTNAVASLRPSGSLPAPGHMPTGSTMAQIVSRGRLRVGVDQNTFLFGYRDPASGQIVGFDIDIARAMAQAIFGDPNKIQFVAITSAERIPYVQNGTVDIVADTMTINCARWQQVDFSTVYYSAGQSVLVPKSSKAKGIADLGHKKVCAAAGSTSITAIAAAASHPIPVSVNDWTDCLVLLQQNQVAAISTDDTILRGLSAQDPDTKLVGGQFTAEPYGLAMSPKAPDLVRFVNGVLDAMRGDGRWAAIYDRWLGGPAPAAPAPTYKD
jgi:polar amino acid transport system substrate-binding protein